MHHKSIIGGQYKSFDFLASLTEATSEHEFADFCPDRLPGERNATSDTTPVTVW